MVRFRRQSCAGHWLCIIPLRSVDREMGASLTGAGMVTGRSVKKCSYCKRCFSLFTCLSNLRPTISFPPFASSSRSLPPVSSATTPS